MKRVWYMAALAFLISACSSDKPKEATQADDTYESAAAAPADNGKGIGPAKTVSLTSPLNSDAIAKGKAVYEMKCQACHRLDDQRVVGPGWKDITKKRKPEWIINMIVNVEEMLEKDAEAQKLIEEYLMKMPNQNVTEQEARDLLEFMRQNDGEV
jgi:mono/diheme cytochrome c family protein